MVHTKYEDSVMWVFNFKEEQIYDCTESIPGEGKLHNNGTPSVYYSLRPKLAIMVGMFYTCIVKQSTG